MWVGAFEQIYLYTHTYTRKVNTVGTKMGKKTKYHSTPKFPYPFCFERRPLKKFRETKFEECEKNKTKIAFLQIERET